MTERRRNPAATKADIEKIAQRIDESRKDDLQKALDRQTISIEKLFDAKIAGMTDAIRSNAAALHSHTMEDAQNFHQINATLSTMKTGLAITKFKLAGIAAAIIAIASTVATFLAKSFISTIVVNKP